MDSATWGRWWCAAHPHRALRLPAWEEVGRGAFLSTFQHAHVMHAVDALLHTSSRARLLSAQAWEKRGCVSRRMQPTSGACTMPRLSQACLLGYTPSPQHALQGDAAHQAQRHTWLTPNDSPGTWYTRRGYQASWAIPPFHRTVFTAHTWMALPAWEAVPQFVTLSHSSGLPSSVPSHHALTSCCAVRTGWRGTRRAPRPWLSANPSTPRSRNRWTHL
jgi:hypothetical protein